MSAEPWCINLEEALPKHRIRMSLDHAPGQWRDPWNFEIPCWRWKAFVYPHGRTTLQAWITTRYAGKALDLLATAGARPHQVGDGEATVLFDVADAPAVLDLLRAKLKRPAPAAGIAALARYRQAQKRRGDLESPIGPQGLGWRGGLP